MAGVPEFSIFIKFNSSGPAWLVDVAGKWVLLVLSPVEQAGLLRLGGRAWRSRDSTLGLWPGALAPGATGWHPRGGAASWSPDQAQWTCVCFSVLAHVMRLDWRPEPGCPRRLCRALQTLGPVERTLESTCPATLVAADRTSCEDTVRVLGGWYHVGPGREGGHARISGDGSPSTLGDPCGTEVGAVSCRWGARPAVQSQAVLGLPSALSGGRHSRMGALWLGAPGHCGYNRWGHLAQTRGVREGFLEEVTEEPSPE